MKTVALRPTRGWDCENHTDDESIKTIGLAARDPTNVSTDRVSDYPDWKQYA